MRIVLVNQVIFPMSSQILRPVAPPSLNKTQAKPASRMASAQPLDTGVLFAGSSEVVITHGTEVYRLRLTRQNRLILTK